ncbi:MAG TPA: hypothetical protein VJI97_03580 [Candidatus Nanoarchaeia archaeon]|nr:hypothetical protein [Candidatus Nanoarchaeia archaeon]
MSDYEFDVNNPSKYGGLSGSFKLTPQEPTISGVGAFKVEYTQGVNGHTKHWEFMAYLIDEEFSIRNLGGAPRWLNPNNFDGLTRILADEFSKVKDKIPVQ